MSSCLRRLQHSLQQKHSWCCLRAAVFPRRFFFRCQRNVPSFIFICCSYRAAGRYWWVLFVLCPHFWGTSTMVSTRHAITHRDGSVWWQAEHVRDRPKLYVARPFLPVKWIPLSFCPPPPHPLLYVNASTGTQFLQHSENTKSKHILHQQQGIIICHLSSKQSHLHHPERRWQARHQRCGPCRTKRLWWTLRPRH